MAIHHGDLFNVLPTFAAESIDACVTDPPYGIGFMGKKWDTFAPKHILSAAKTKQRKDPVLLENANVRGRKRSPAMSPSQIEYDRTLAGQRGFQAWTESWAREVYRVLKPGAYLLVCGAPRSFHRMTCGLEDAGFEIRDCFSWMFGQGFPKSLNLEGEFDGWGTGLKPSWEPIIVARKPFGRGVLVNMQQHGVGAINIDGCRVRSDDAQGGEYVVKRFAPGADINKTGDWKQDKDFVGNMKPGRWPANCLLDEIAAAVLDEQTGELTSGDYSGARNSPKTRNSYGAFAGNPGAETPRKGDSGGASRFFYVAKPDTAERNAGMGGGADWLYCTDEKFRPVEPGTFPLAHGLPGRVGRLRGYGNAIVPEKAAEVIRAYMEIAG